MLAGLCYGYVLPDVKFLIVLWSQLSMHPRNTCYYGSISFPCLNYFDNSLSSHNVSVVTKVRVDIHIHAYQYKL